MKALIFSAVLMASPALADERCYEFIDDPSWRITETDIGFRWNRAGDVTDLTTGSAGTGISVRAATDHAGNVHSYIFVRDALVIDMQVYEPAPCERPKP